MWKVESVGEQILLLLLYSEDLFNPQFSTDDDQNVLSHEVVTKIVPQSLACVLEVYVNQTNQYKEPLYFTTSARVSQPTFYSAFEF